MSQEIQKSAAKLGVGQKDIVDIKKKVRRGKIIYWVINAIIAIITFIAGFMVGSAMGEPSSGYPYAGGLLTTGYAGPVKKRTKIAIIASALIIFLLALKARADVPEFTTPLRYGVYNR